MVISIEYQRPSVGEQRRRGGWGAPGRWFEEKGAHGAAAAIASCIQELGERSASAPQVRMRRESNLGNCECKR
eukprot:6213085-Pleurochrysis_carterae.AAC.2